MEKTPSKLEKYEFVKDLPKNIVRIPTFLSGDFGKDFLDEFQGRAKKEYGNADVLNVLNESDGIIKGSNDYAVVLANQILRQVGLRTTTPADLEKILRSKALDLNEVYVDTALVLRSKDNSNEYLARDLRKQLGKKKLPKMIPLAGLDLRVDDNAPYGLAFNVREDAEVIHDKILNFQSEYFNSEDINEKTGLPKKLNGGDRYFYAGNSGLSRLGLGGSSDLNSSDGNLDSSNDSGRVVVTDAEGVGAKK